MVVLDLVRDRSVMTIGGSRNDSMLLADDDDQQRESAPQEDRRMSDLVFADGWERIGGCWDGFFPWSASTSRFNFLRVGGPCRGGRGKVGSRRKGRTGPFVIGAGARNAIIIITQELQRRINPLSRSKIVGK